MSDDLEARMREVGGDKVHLVPIEHAVTVAREAVEATEVRFAEATLNERLRWEGRITEAVEAERQKYELLVEAAHWVVDDSHCETDHNGLAYALAALERKTDQ